MTLLTVFTLGGTGAVVSGLPDNGTAYNKQPVFVVSPTGRVRWTSYIPIKQFPLTSAAKADRTDDDGALTVTVLGSASGLTEWVDYWPVVEVADPDTGKWRTDSVGFLPVVAIV
jgi:hypothetical protein